jgi:cytochrome c peroxidase
MSHLAANRQTTRLVVILLLFAALLAGFAVHDQYQQAATRTLRRQMALHHVSPLDLRIPTDAALVQLGQALFFDKELSGNRDIACATCHHPTLASADNRPLSVGTGGSGLGADRLMGAGRILVPRNAPEIFNRAAPEWETVFWDGRINLYHGHFNTPAGAATPPGLDNVLAAQAIFPITSREEMRGHPGDRDVRGAPNELAEFADYDFEGMWGAVMQRLLSNASYRALFEQAFPTIPPDQISIVQMGNAIAAFETVAFSYDDSPWYDFVRGDDDALTWQQKRGALLFYGEGRCALCHTGSLMTDQRHHNIAVPQFGPGKESDSGVDFGRFLVTHDPMDRYAFRTPPLANVALTAPYMHNGAYATLEEVVRHHLDPRTALANYDPSSLSYTIRRTWTPITLGRQAEILHTLSPTLREPIPLSERQISDLVAFLEALTCASAEDMGRFVPATVPSGLPVAD